MKKIKITLCIVLIVAILIGCVLWGYLSCNHKNIRFPLADIIDDGSEYILLKDYGGNNYVIEDTSFLIKHKWDVFIIYSPELEDSTGDGYFRVYKNGECIFSCQFDDGGYFDEFINYKYNICDAQEFLEMLK